MRIERRCWASAGLLLGSALSCSDSETVIYGVEGMTGELTARLGLGAPGDVTAVRVDVVAAADGCEGPVIATETVSIAGEPAAEARFVLPEGEVLVCAAPLAGASASAACGPTNAAARVVAGETSEVSLVSQCAGANAGVLEATVAFNTAPSLDAVTLDPSDDITTCESARIAVTASDPDGDPLAFAWSATGGRLRSDGASATFSAAVAGDYTLSVQVSDARGGHAELSVPIRVTAAVCGVAPEVQDIFLARCAPCHTTGSSGGLSLATAEAAFANLVDQPARGAACTSRIRVIRGDAAASYLIAKLRGEAGICGLQMPRNLPPLPEAEIQTIAAWINGLPH
jgi:hypothetical protein